MKKTQIVILIIIAVAIIAAVAIFGYANTNDENGVQVVASTMVPETTEQVTNTTTTNLVEPTVVPEQPAQMLVDDGTGKIYFVGKDAMQLALEGDLQWRLDAAIIDTNNV